VNDQSFSPHARQIDGIGGAEHLTSKVAIVSPSERPGVDVDYLFAQIGITEAVVEPRRARTEGR
jgi:4-oxalomesaconate tautomerase